MAKYGQFKYSKQKYGQYSIVVPGGVELGQLTRYRLRSINSVKKESRPIVSQSVYINGTGGSVKVRLRTDKSDWVYMQTIEVDKHYNVYRIKTVGPNGESKWIESVVGTIRKKGI